MKSYFGENPQSRRAAESSTSAGQLSTMPWRLMSFRYVIAADGNARSTFGADFVGRRSEGPDVVNDLLQLLARRLAKRKQGVDAVRHRHEGYLRVGTDEAGVRLPFAAAWIISGA